MNFAIGADETAFAETVRAALASYQPADWAPGAALDDDDASLSARLRELGLADAAETGHGFVVAAGLELGRARAPLALVDELAVGETALAAGGLARYAGRRSEALDLREDGAFLVSLDGASIAAALDSQGFVRLGASGEPAPFPELETWAAFHTAYFGGLAAAALPPAVDHARARIQFGQPLLALAPVQQLLAEAASLTRGLELLAWEDADDPWPALAHAGEAACRVCEISHQVHGAIGYALEAPVHASFRRAHATRLFTRAVARAAVPAR
ncbi:MAG: acyl-CoA dehydrogenase family protein [Gaiellaceae bacterium]